MAAEERLLPGVQEAGLGAGFVAGAESEGVPLRYNRWVGV